MHTLFVNFILFFLNFTHAVHTVPSFFLFSLSSLLYALHQLNISPKFLPLTTNICTNWASKSTTILFKKHMYVFSFFKSKIYYMYEMCFFIVVAMSFNTYFINFTIKTFNMFNFFILEIYKVMLISIINLNH